MLMQSVMCTLGAMTYTEAKQLRDTLADAVSKASAQLRAIPGHGAGPMGLTPDHIKATPEWQEAKALTDATFKRLQRFNSIFVKQYRREIKADRKA